MIRLLWMFVVWKESRRVPRISLLTKRRCASVNLHYLPIVINMAMSPCLSICENKVSVEARSTLKARVSGSRQ